jgi:hypothetical protein
MKQLFHLSISCHSETLFRDEEDIRCITNILALTAFSCQVEIWADALMGTHLHLIVFGEETLVLAFARRLKHRITKYHRGRHRGKGPLFDPPVFLLRLEGPNHILAAISYVLRNGMHHAQSATPFGYGPCSVNDLFREDLGKPLPTKRITSRSEIASNLPRFSEFPDSFAMDGHGMILRDSFEEHRQVELYYKTPRAFLYQMNRLSSEEWEAEQRRDDTPDAPVTLSSIEPGADGKSLTDWLTNEKGYHFRRDRKTDLEVCRIIDQDLMNRYHGLSVYQLDTEQKYRIAKFLQCEMHIPHSQIRRCLIL